MSVEMLDDVAAPSEEALCNERPPVAPALAKKIGCVPTALCVGCPMLKLCGQVAPTVEQQPSASADAEQFDVSGNAAQADGPLDLTSLFQDGIYASSEPTETASADIAEVVSEIDQPFVEVDTAPSYLEQLFDDSVAVVVATSLRRPTEAPELVEEMPAAVEPVSAPTQETVAAVIPMESADETSAPIVEASVRVPYSQPASVDSELEIPVQLLPVEEAAVPYIEQQPELPPISLPEPIRPQDMLEEYIVEPVMEGRETGAHTEDIRIEMASSSSEVAHDSIPSSDSRASADVITLSQVVTIDAASVLAVQQEQSPLARVEAVLPTPSYESNISTDDELVEPLKSHKPFEEIVWQDTVSLLVEDVEPVQTQPHISVPPVDSKSEKPQNSEVTAPSESLIQESPIASEQGVQNNEVPDIVNYVHALREALPQQGMHFLDASSSDREVEAASSELHLPADEIKPPIQLSNQMDPELTHAAVTISSWTLLLADDVITRLRRLASLAFTSVKYY